MGALPPISAFAMDVSPQKNIQESKVADALSLCAHQHTLRPHQATGRLSRRSDQHILTRSTA